MLDAKNATRLGVPMAPNGKPRSVKIVWDSGYVHLDIHDRSDLDLVLHTFDQVFNDLLDEVSRKIEQSKGECDE